MDFTFNEEQQMLRDSVRRFLTEQYSFDKRKALLAGPSTHSPVVWKRLADLGILALNLPESAGGLGAGIVEVMLVASALGESLVVEPFLESAVIASRLLASLADPAQLAAWAPSLADGSLIAVLAHDASRESAGPVCVSATRSEGGWRLAGQIPLVYHAPTAGLLLVPAALADGSAPTALFAVKPATLGVELAALRTLDDCVAADVVLDGVDVPAQALVSLDAAAAVAAALDVGLAVHAADMLGALETAFHQTLEYIRTRSQFGGPIGRFQALQHRMADMLAKVEMARSMVYLAVVRCEDADASARAAVLSATRVILCDAARFVGQQSVQLHGGMGVTDDLAISHYFRRLTAATMRFGSGDQHLGRYGDALALGAA